MQGADDLALVEPVLVGFVSIVTNGRVWTDPAPTTHAIEFVDAMRRGRRSRWLPTTNATWQRFSAIAGADPHVRGNLVPDAWLAAQALAHGCRLATADRGFARFEGLDWFDPVAL
ncbi:MAG: TA system VapC family ribonuclease toxin [Ilumatobacteraceae bacterium]